MTDRATWELAGAQQGHVALEAAWRWAKPWLMAGHRLQLKVEEAPKSRDQEKKYHAMIGDIAAQVSLIPGREHETPEDAKRLLVSAFREDTKNDPVLAGYWRDFGHFNLAPGLRGELVALGMPTRKFKRPLAAAFITWLGAFGDEHGVVWTEPKAPLPDGPVIEHASRDEAYRRRVAELPCVNCGRPGPSQCAHANSQRWGKGMGIKADDGAVFPLCADRPGVVGCHTLFDQGKLFPKEQARVAEEMWIERTRERLGATA